MAALDYDVVVVGSGPAGLAAATRLGAAGQRVLVLERDLFGGNLQHTGLIEDYPEYPDGIVGADLAGKLIEQATRSGATVEQGDVSAIELFSRSRFVACTDGRGFSCAVVVIATGTHYEKLGLPNEDRFRGRGVVDCTPCDGGFFVDRDVVVYGSHEYARRDAEYLSGLGCRVTRLAPDQISVDAIEGMDRLEAITLTDRASGQQRKLTTSGLFVRVGVEPANAAFRDTLDLDDHGYLLANDHGETSAQYVLAAGDIRSNAPRSIAAAIADGNKIAEHARQLLTTLVEV